MKKILKKLVFIFIIFLVSFVVYVKYWAGPEFTCKRFETAVSSFWEGQLTFEHVQFNFFGDQLFKGVVFLDNNGRKWAYADTINATLGNWPSRNYYLRDVYIDKLTVQFLLDTDKKTFPLKSAFSASTPKDPNAVLQTVNINSGSVSVIRINGEKVYLGQMFLLAQRREDEFEFLSAINKTDKLENIVFKGLLSKDNFSLNNISGIFCDGKMEGALEIKNHRSKTPDITGRFRIEEIDLAKLSGKFNRPGKIKTGKATLDYSFNARNKSLGAISGHGFLTIDNADLLPMPLLTKVSKTVGLTDKEMQTTSDATAAFSSKGLELEIEQAYFTNQHEALVIEPGGIIDLKTRSIDMHVAAIRLRLVGDFIRKVPVIRLFAKLKDKLTRLRIEGKWSDPPSKLIKKQPVKDIKDGVIDFFIDVANAGGQLIDNND